MLSPPDPDTLAAVLSETLKGSEMPPANGGAGQESHPFAPLVLRLFEHLRYLWLNRWR